MQKRTIRILHKIDPDGREVVLVPLVKTDKHATLYTTDFEELIALGLNPSWAYHLNSVRCVFSNPSHSYHSVARVLTDARPGQVVRFMDKDTTNLRRDNLFLDVGFSKHHDRSLLEPYHRMLPRRPIVEHIFEEQAKISSEPGSAVVCNA